LKEKSKMRILITGSDGLMGSNIIPFLQQYFDILPMVERDWDICDPDRGREILSKIRPDTLLNLAAMTNVDGCEEKSGMAYRVNGEGPGVLTDICEEQGIKLVQISTDYVFNGMKTTPYTEKDQPDPVSVYGKSKLIGEQAVIRRSLKNLVIRTEWIYGKGGSNFIEKVTKIGKEKGQVAVVDDQEGSPTFARDLARPLVALIQKNKSGIYHITNSGSCTWFQFACAIFDFLGMNVVCQPITTDQSQRKATRPANSVMDCSKLKADTGIKMRHWREALYEYLSQS
jgi:dTDP-4-dehydrorhamnose reductase